MIRFILTEPKAKPPVADIAAARAWLKKNGSAQIVAAFDAKKK